MTYAEILAEARKLRDANSPFKTDALDALRHSEDVLALLIATIEQIQAGPSTDFGRDKVPAQARPDEWGNAISLGWVYEDGDRENGFERDLTESDAIAILHTDARKTLQPCTRYEIRKSIPTNFGRSWAVAWYRSIGMDAQRDWPAIPSHFAPDLGCHILERCLTP